MKRAICLPPPEQAPVLVVRHKASFPVPGQPTNEILRKAYAIESAEALELARRCGVKVPHEH